MAAPKRLYLIDGSGYIFRAFHGPAAHDTARRYAGERGLRLLHMLMKLLDDLRDHTVDELVAVVFDAKRQTFRNDIYPEYKAHRPEAPPELVPQFGLIREATRAFNVPCVEMEGFEAMT